MAKTITVYRGARIKDEKGNETSFYTDIGGSVYEDHDGTVRKVGEFTRKGVVQVSPKYAKKFPDRLKQIMKKAETKENENEVAD